MHVINARNVNDAWQKGLMYLTTVGELDTSRAGEVIVSPSPVTTVYEQPMERVLFDSRRDANPFFHLMESVWMLSGRRDATFLDRYVRDFSSRFAEDDGDAHGAYGHRWRKFFLHDVEVDHDDITGMKWAYMDQLRLIGEMLYQNPRDRRAVLAMWAASDDLGASKRDIPCNTHVYFRGRLDRTDNIWYLDATVCCRSNDAVWGAYGANAVHMSIMAEMVAGLAGMRLGIYRQVSNNFHAYTSILPKVHAPGQRQDDPYETYDVHPSPIVPFQTSSREVIRDSAERTLDSVDRVLEAVETDQRVMDATGSWWVDRVVWPVALAHMIWKDDRAAGYEACRLITASDWRMACQEWMARRMKTEELDQVRSC